MARIRTIKPEFFLDEDIADDLSHTERLAFIGLWTQCDKAGRTADRPRRLKVQIFPHEELDFEAVLVTLERTNYIQRYEAGGRRYIQVRTFDQHQRPRTDEPESQLPPPEQLTKAETNPSLLRDSTALGKEGKGKGKGEQEGKGKLTADAVLALWNEIVTKPIPKATKLTTDRRKKINARLQVYPDPETWRTDWIVTGKH